VLDLARNKLSLHSLLTCPKSAYLDIKDFLQVNE